MKIKCFVTIKGPINSEEKRLFKVDPNSETPYDDLLAKLIDCYKNDSCEFTLSWKDEEGDDIVVSSNGELQAALEECPGAPNSTLKMNVTATQVQRTCKTKKRLAGGNCEKTKKKKGKCDGQKNGGGKCGGPARAGVPNWENPAMTHPGVTCDSCEGPVMGPRWKCSVCPDFDLCKPCKKNGIHSEHLFVKIPYRLRHWRHFGQVNPLVTPINFPNPNGMFEFELAEDTMTDKERISLEELQVQKALEDLQVQTADMSLSDMYISDNLIGEPRTETTNSLSTEISEKTVPEEEQVEDANVSAGTQEAEEEEDMVTVEKDEVTEKTNSGDDGIRVTGSDEGEFVMLNNAHVELPDMTGEEYMYDTYTVEPSNIYPTLVTLATAPPTEDVPQVLPPPITPVPAVPVDSTPAAVPAQSVPVVPVSRPGSGGSGASSTRPPYGYIPVTRPPKPTQSPITTLALPPHVHAALSCMLEMGYTNSGEWLAKLLHNKNGDINTVIDILNSKMTN